MRTIAFSFVAVVLASSAFLAADAQSTGCAPVSGGNLYATASGCADYMRCGTNFCSCINSRTSASPDSCIANSNATCAEIQRCLHNYTMCIERPSATQAGCAQLSSAVHMAEMVALGSGYAGSQLQRSCRHRVCTIMNGTSTTCNFGTNESEVCAFRPRTTTAAPTAAPTMAPPMTNASTNASMTSMAAGTTAAPTNAAPANFVAAITALLVINGNDFGLIEANATAWEELRVALATDIAGLLGIDTSFMWIIRMFVASLHTEFAVDTAAGVAPNILADRLAAVGTNTSWLNAVKAAYARVSNETLTMEAISVTQTAAPGEVTPIPPTPVPSNSDSLGSASAGVFSAVAAVAAAAVAVLAL